MSDGANDDPPPPGGRDRVGSPIAIGSLIAIGLVIGMLIAATVLLVAGETADRRGARALDLASASAGGSRSVSVDDWDRTYSIHVPDHLPMGPVPLVLGLHGAGGSGRQFEESTHLDAVADELGFIVVYPDGVEARNDPSGKSSRTWNAGQCCGEAEARDVDDLAFIHAVIKDVERDHDIAAERVVAIGHSNGGMLAYRLACESSGEITGIAVYGSTLELDLCKPSRPVSLLAVHGSVDENVPYEGGVGTRSVMHTDYRPVPASIDVLVTADRCDPNPVSATDHLHRTATFWTSCDDATSVQEVLLVGASHAWPGGDTPEGRASGYDASTEMATWLLDHPRPR